MVTERHTCVLKTPPKHATMALIAQPMLGSVLIAHDPAGARDQPPTKRDHDEREAENDETTYRSDAPRGGFSCVD